MKLLVSRFRSLLADPVAAGGGMLLQKVQLVKLRPRYCNAHGIKSRLPHGENHLTFVQILCS